MITNNIIVLYLTITPYRLSTTASTECWFRCLRPKLIPILVTDKVGDFYRWSKTNNIATYHVSLPFPNKCFPLPFFFSLIKLIVISKKHNIQLIHANEHDVYPIAKYLSNFVKIPLVVSVHSIMPKKFGEWAFKNSKFLKRIYFVSRSCMKHSLPALKNVNKNIIRILYNCIDTNKFFPNANIRPVLRERLGLSSNDFLIGAAAAIQPIKQLEHVILCLEKITNSKVKFILAGGAKVGFETYSQKFLDFAQKTLGKRFIYLGHLDDLFEFYNLIDVYVCTSKEEALSVSILEALSSGCPVIAYPSKGSNEEILNQEISIVVPQDDICALTDAILTLANDLHRRSEMGVKARRYAIEKFSMEIVSKTLFNDYLSLLKDA